MSVYKSQLWSQEVTTSPRNRVKTAPDLGLVTSPFSMDHKIVNQKYEVILRQYTVCRNLVFAPLALSSASFISLGPGITGTDEF